mgnify:CR=1 FL=1
MSETTEMILVLARDVKYGFTQVLVKDQLVYNTDSVAISKPCKISFEHVDQSIVQEAMIKLVIVQMEQDEIDHEEKVKKNNEKLSELRALTAPPVANDFDDDTPF